MDRIKGNLSLVIPLIFSSLERIDTISTAMELRRFGKNKKRTWYTYQPLKQMDYISLEDGQKVNFEVEQGQRGLQATNITKIG